MRVHPRLTPTPPQAPSLERDHRNSASLGTLFALNGFMGGSRYAPGPVPARRLPAAQLASQHTAREGRLPTMARRPHSHRRHPRQRGRRRGGERSYLQRVDARRVATDKATEHSKRPSAVGASAQAPPMRSIAAARRGVDDAPFPGGIGMGAGGRRGLPRWWQPSQRPHLLAMM